MSRAILPAGGRNAIHPLYDDRAASCAAEAAARATQEPQFLYVRGERETLAAASVLPTAWGDRTPLIVLTQVPSDAEKKVREVLAVVSRRYVGGQSGEPPELTLDRLTPLSWRDFPVHVSIAHEHSSEDVLAAAAGYVPRPNAPTAAAPPEGGGVAAWIADEWSRSRRPALLLGQEALRTCEPREVRSLADSVDAPILLTAGATALVAGLAGKWSALLESDAVVPGQSPVWALTMQRCDVLLALGARLTEADLFGLHDLRWFRGRCIAVSSLDIGVPEEGAGWVRCSPDAVITPIREALRGLGPRAVRPHWRARVERRTRTVRRIAVDEARKAERSRGIDPAWAAWRIATSAPRGTRFIAEGNITGLWLRTYAPVEQVITPIHMGTIGVAIPWMAGVGAARPDESVWAAVGDGAFLFQPAALRDLERMGPRAAVFVFNDASWNSIRMAQTLLFSGRYVGTDISPASYCDLATSLGCEAQTVSTAADLDVALASVLDPGRRRPAVVDIRLRAGSTPWIGLGFGLAEVDYMLRPMAWRIVASTISAIARRRLQLRPLRVVLRTALA